MKCAMCGEMIELWAHFYDIEARPLCVRCFGKMTNDIDYRRVALSNVGEGDLHAEVSTVLIGIDMGFFGNTPLIFETMIFAPEDTGYEEYYCERYPTKEAALAGHDQAVQWAKDNLFLDWNTEPEGVNDNGG